MEQGIYLSGINKAELKDLLKEALLDILKETKDCVNAVPEILSIKQAAIFLNSKVTTLYEKTSAKTIPHFKKGNRLYFKREELEAWIQKGKVKTVEDIQAEAITYSTRSRKLVDRIVKIQA